MALCGIFFIDLIGRLNSVGFGIKSAFIYVLAFDTLLGQDIGHRYRTRIRFYGNDKI